MSQTTKFRSILQHRILTQSLVGLVTMKVVYSSSVWLSLAVTILVCLVPSGAIKENEVFLEEGPRNFLINQSTKLPGVVCVGGSGTDLIWYKRIKDKWQRVVGVDGRNLSKAIYTFKADRSVKVHQKTLYFNYSLVTEDDSGQYLCQDVNNQSHGERAETEINFVRNFIEFTNCPSAVTFNESEGALNCEWETTVPDGLIITAVELFRLVNGVKLPFHCDQPLNNPKIVKNSCSFNDTRINSNFEGIYRVNVTINEGGQYHQESHDINVTVLLKNLVMKFEDITFEEGKEADLRCELDAGQNSKLTLEFGNDILKSITCTANSNCSVDHKFNSADESISGTYWCTASFGKNGTLMKSANIEVVATPRIVKWSVTSFNDSIYVKCQPSGLPMPSISWFWGNRDLSELEDACNEETSASCGYGEDFSDLETSPWIQFDSNSSEFLNKTRQKALFCIAENELGRSEQRIDFVTSKESSSFNLVLGGLIGLVIIGIGCTSCLVMSPWYRKRITGEYRCGEKRPEEIEISGDKIRARCKPFFSNNLI